MADGKDYPPIYPKWQFDFDIGCLLAERQTLRQRHAAGLISGFDLLKREKELLVLESGFRHQWGRSAGIFGALKVTKRLMAAAKSVEEYQKLRRKAWFLGQLCGEILFGQPKREVDAVELIEAEPNFEARKNPLGFYECLQAGRWLPVSLEFLKEQPTVFWREYANTAAVKVAAVVG